MRNVIINYKHVRSVLYIQLLKTNEYIILLLFCYHSNEVVISLRAKKASSHYVSTLFLNFENKKR